MRYTLCALFFHIILIFLWCSTGFCAEGVEWGRLRLAPKLSVGEQYSDNVFLTEKNEEDEYITTILPELSLDFAFSPRSILNVGYKADFRIYTEFDNFRKDHHRGGLSWTWTSPKGSEFAIGADAEDSSMQPYSEKDRHKDFVKGEAFVDSLLKVGAFTGLGIRYAHTSRRFDSRLDKIDEYDRDAITLDILYRRFRHLPLLLEYSYYHQDNNDLDEPSTDMDTHTVFIGARWDPTAKLSGTLKVGYTQTDFEEVDDFSGFATDTDLTYRFSDITTFKLRAYRMLVRSTWAGRETGNYFISSGGGLSATYRSAPIAIVLDFSYTNNDFEQKDWWYEEREDNYFRAGVMAEHLLQDWLLLSLSYHYSRNDSNFASVDYRENRVEARCSLFI
ncbi:MAG: outer membrane beta-barrel protein [Desulfobacterales bacterium]|nr:outer membrane beta-barrel protein [Desulfobacterales bacterium]